MLEMLVTYDDFVTVFSNPHLLPAVCHAVTINCRGRVDSDGRLRLMPP
ncbi:hypothetical protein HMPREF0580_1688 [Mobiluncus mulieris ATCC 35239]|uniref:Uncharacterized protein n=1 Tax=Mobiluncus mulieris ATCC 35239 TaxID=871571 RepID=E0QS23_9ACTO|nr:hypothetical protein HMPREF0580_1688 [Mobiluncus mulieris ATCC 35239]